MEHRRRGGGTGEFQSAFNAAFILTQQVKTVDDPKEFQSAFNAAFILTMRCAGSRGDESKFQSAFNAAFILTVALIKSVIAQTYKTFLPYPIG